MNPAEIPIQAIGSYVELCASCVEELFGEGYVLNGRERIEIVQLGSVFGLADIRPGEHSRACLDGATRATLRDRPLRLRGPKGFREVLQTEPIPSILNLPAGVALAWGLTEGQTTMVAFGTVAVQADVSTGSVVALEVDRSIVAAASSTPVATAHWLPQTMWELESTQASENSVPQLVKRIITENDVRKARMEKRSIVVGSEQIVTPAARALGDELGLFV